MKKNHPVAVNLQFMASVHLHVQSFPCDSKQESCMSQTLVESLDQFSVRLLGRKKNRLLNESSINGP